MLPQDALWNQFQEHPPQSLLLVSNSPIPAIEQWAIDHRCEFKQVSSSAELENLGRFELSLVLDWQPNSQKYIELLARIRNLHSHKIWLLAPTINDHPNIELLGLGFRREQQFVKQKLSSYGYKLEHYNHKREWNSPKHWANPENWGKYWW